MEQNQIKTNPKSQTANQQEDPEVIEKPFCERPYEEVEDGYIDDRGFYTIQMVAFGMMIILISIILDLIVMEVAMINMVFINLVLVMMKLQDYIMTKRNLSIPMN